VDCRDFRSDAQSTSAYVSPPRGGSN
jgi:hypothetical protein